MFKTPFSFEGRIRRTEFCLSVLIYYFLVVIVSLAMEAGRMPVLVAFAATIPSIWFLIAQGIKRCHDRGNSGWYQLLPGYYLILMFGKGDSGNNEFGSDPKAIAKHAEETVKEF